MISFLREYLGTIIVAIILVILIVGITLRLIKRKREGKCVACSCCDDCASTTCPSKRQLEVDESQSVDTTLP